MQRWEYYTTRCHGAVGLDSQLESLGADGWEAFSLTGDCGSTVLVALKRPVPEPEPAIPTSYRCPRCGAAREFPEAPCGPLEYPCSGCGFLSTGEAWTYSNLHLYANLQLVRTPAELLPVVESLREVVRAWPARDARWKCGNALLIARNAIQAVNEAESLL